MIFLSEEKSREFDALLRQFEGADYQSSEVPPKLIALDPHYAPAYAAIAMKEAAAGNREAAEAMLWKALELWPSGYQMYAALAQLRAELNPRDAMARRLLHLGTWKLAFSEEIADSVADFFQQHLGNAGDPRDPETYLALAMATETHLKVSPPPPEVEERLQPWVLLNDLQREADEVVTHETLARIVDSAGSMRPLLRGVVRAWVRHKGDVTDDTACLSLALLGEIGDREVLDELLELVLEPELFLHVHWAIHRFARRLPEETLEAFRAVTPQSSAAIRCGLADHIYLMPSVPGLEDVLAGLLTGLTGKEEDTPYLLLAVEAALVKHGAKARAVAITGSWEPKLTTKGARWRREVLESEEGFISTLASEGLEGLDIEDVCVERVLIDEEDEEDFFDDDEPEPAPKPGRNDPCWCGSGKKYKKCHLASDEQAEGQEPDPGLDREYPVPEAIDVPSGAITWLTEASLKYLTNQEQAQAMKLYFDIGQNIDDEEVGRYVQWMLFDYRHPKSGKTALERFLVEEGPRLSDRERAFLESLHPSRLQLYETGEIQKGRGVQLKNTYTGETQFVRDVSSSRELAAGVCLLTRLHEFEGNTLMVGDGITVPRGYLAPFKDRIAAGSKAAGQTEAGFVAANAHRLHRMLSEIGKPRLENIKIVTREGDELEICHAHYQVLDQAVLLERLRNLPELEEHPGEEAGGGLHFGWLEAGPPDQPRAAFGHVLVKSGRLRLECTSRQRLKKARRLIEKHTKGVVKHLGDSFERPVT